MSPSPPMSCRSVPGQNAPASMNGMAIRQAQRMALEKYRCARASPCACRMAYRVAAPRPIIEPKAKIRLYMGRQRFSRVTPSVPAAWAMK